MWGKAVIGGTVLEGSLGDGKLLLLLSSVAATLIGLRRGLETFGVSASRVAAAVTGKMHVGDLEAKTGLRHQFAETFQEVTEALKRNSLPCGLVIFVDDLDRCQPDKTLGVLEIVNFLVSSGDCHVILGMAPDQVEGCVGLQFKQVAEQLANRAAVRTGGKRPAEAEILTTFARDYLEKLVNIEVPVPTFRSNQSEALLDPFTHAKTTSAFPDDGSTPAKEPMSRIDRSLETARRVWKASGDLGERFVRAYGPLAVLGLLIIGFGALVMHTSDVVKNVLSTRTQPTVTPSAAFDPQVVINLARSLASHDGKERAAASAALRVLYPERADTILATIAGVLATPTPSRAEPAPTAETTRARDDLPSRPASFAPSRTADIQTWWFYPVTLILLITVVPIGIGILAQPLRPETDHPTFARALKDWAPLVAWQTPTPRSVKRFLNRVRYFAMRQKAHEPRSTNLERFLVWLGWRTARTPAAGLTAEQIIPEDVLVAISAARHVRLALDRDGDGRDDPERVDELWTNFPGYLDSVEVKLRADSGGMTDAETATLVHKLRELATRHGDGEIAKYRDAYERLADVKVR